MRKEQTFLKKNDFAICREEKRKIVLTYFTGQVDMFVMSCGSLLNLCYLFVEIDNNSPM